MNRKKSIHRMLLFYGTLLIIIFTSLFIYQSIKIEQIKHRHSQEKNRDSLITERKILLKKGVDDLISTVKEKRISLEADRKASLKQKTYAAYDNISELYFYNKESNSNDLKAAFVDHLTKINSENPSSYHFCFSIEGTPLLFPSHPELQGITLSTVKNQDERDALLRGKEIITNNKEGFLTYDWKKPGTQNLYSKLAYIKYFEPLGLVIGTGEYYSDFEAPLKIDFVKSLNNYQDKFEIRLLNIQSNILNFSDGNVTISDETLLQQESSLLKEYTSTRNNSKGIFSIYTLTQNGAKTEYLSYINSIPEWGYILFAKLPVDDIEEVLSESNTLLKKQYISNIAKSSSVIVVLMMLVWITMFYILKNIAEKYKKTLASLKEHSYNGSLPITAPENPFLEFDTLIGEMNKIFESHVLSIKSLEKGTAENVFDTRQKHFVEQLTNELRVELNSITSSSAVLIESDIPLQYRTTASSVRSAAENILNIVNDIVAISDLNLSPDIKISEKSFKVSDLTDDIRNRYPSYNKNPNISLNIQLDNSLPKKIIGDYDKIKRLLYFLTSISSKGTSKGRILLSISAPEKSEGRATVLFNFNYSNTSIGTKIESSFDKSDIETSINIEVAAKILKAFDSRLAVVETTPGFIEIYFSLPFRVDSSEEVPVLKKTNVSKDSICLIAEDNEINLSALSFLVEKNGVKVIQALNGSDAVSLFKKNNVDIIIMDIQMPEMDGLEATRIIRSLQMSGINSHAPIVAITAYNFDKTPDELRELGIDALIEKPYKKEALDAVISKYLKR